MKQKHISFNMRMGLWLSVAAILASASSPLSHQFLVSGKDATPYTPPGWSGPIVAAKTPGTTTSEVLEGGNGVYIDIAVTNNGDTAIAETFDACLWFDGTQVNCWSIAGLASGANFTIVDYVMTYADAPAQSGSHFLELRVDEAVAISGETNKANNNWIGSFTWTETPGALMEDALTVAPSDIPADTNGDSNLPDASDTSAYMIGKVAVSVVLPESVGGNENWTQTEIDQVKSEVQAGLNNWETWYTANGGGNPGLDFVIEWHTNADTVPVPVTDEPIAMAIGTDDQDVWIKEALGVLGATETTYWERAYAYDNTIRAANSADWAFTIFVVDSSTDADGKFNAGTTFPSGSFAYSYLNGPFLVMTYDNADWGISQMSEVLAHQVAHIFGAADQYTGCSGGDASTPFGYLAIANSNCGGTGPSLMLTGQGTPDVTTRRQVGWRDSDATPDGIFDPADTRPVITGFIDESAGFGGTNHIFSGTAYDSPWPSARPITIRKLINTIQFRVDGGAWQDADITTGIVDSDGESFSFATAPDLGGGTHTVDVRAQNNSADPVSQYSAVGADQVGISRLTMTFFNDYFDSATIIPSLPYTSTGVNTTTYTAGEVGKDKDLIACGGDINVNRAAGDHSAWYRYTPTINESVTLDTIGSNVGGDTNQFDTMIGVYLYESGSLTQIDCDDDSAGSLKSLVTVDLPAGKTYYFVVSSFNGSISANGASVSSTKSGVGALAGGFDPGGNLVFHVLSNGVVKVATFADVPTTAFAWAQIESIYAARITGGCSVSPLNYCPNNSVTRAQMAVFLLRGIHGSTYSPPAATGTSFGDVPSNGFAAAWIERLVAEGITAGCGSGNYCPNNPVTRAQMAVFLLRAKHGSGYSPPTATGTAFGDVPSNGFAAAWIERLVAEGITAGCGSGNYCPNNSVTRAQMAVFLQKTFNLPLP